MIRKIARPMLASAYVADGIDTLVNSEAHLDSASTALDSIRSVTPASLADYLPKEPETAARLAGGSKVFAGSLLAIGKAPRFSALVLALTAIPTIIGRHAFWATSDDEEKSARRQGFLTDIAMLGGLGITSVDTSGKPGLKWRASKAAQDASSAVQAKLPSGKEASGFVDQAGDWLSDKASQVQDAAQKAQSAVAEYVDDNKDEWIDRAQSAAEAAKSPALSAAESAKSTAQSTAEGASSTGQELFDRALSNTKDARKHVVKVAKKAQERADKAVAKAEKKNGRAAKKASKKAEKLQAKASKLVERASDRLAKLAK